MSKAKYARTADWAQALSIGTGSRRAKNSLTSNHALIDLEHPYTSSPITERRARRCWMLRDAQDQQQLELADHVAEEVRKIVDPKTVKKLEATTHTFTTERGEKLTLSTAQVMELYELVKRKQAHDHLLKGGVVQPEIKTSQIRRGTDSIRLTGGRSGEHHRDADTGAGEDRGRPARTDPWRAGRLRQQGQHGSLWL
ncbi:MAG: hypothetical protein V8R55_11885 [Dysosmobacter sp.]